MQNLFSGKPFYKRKSVPSVKDVNRILGIVFSDIFSEKVSIKMDESTNHSGDDCTEFIENCETLTLH